MSKETAIERHEAPRRFPLELVREVAGESHPVVIQRKTITRGTEIIHFPKMKPLPRSFFINKVIRIEEKRPGILWGTKTVVRYVARCNQYWSESLESLKQSIPQFSQELENLLLSDDMKQHINGVKGLQSFKLNENIIKVMLIVFAMSIGFGFLMDTILHLVPAQIVEWAP